MSKQVTESGDGEDSHNAKFLHTSPVITRRMRTISQSQRAEEGPSFKGRIKEFCREKGHGFVETLDGKHTYFVHISDIEDEYVPKVGDEVTFKTILIPPKNEKYQAVHVHITHLVSGVTHEQWGSPGLPSSPH